MTIRYDPTKMLRKVAPDKKVKRLVKDNLTPNKAVLSMFDEVDFISKRDIQTVALKTLKQYKTKYRKEKAEGESTRAARENTLNNKALLVNRVQNAVVYQVAQEIKEEYDGEHYKWLPSDANVPDPEHQLKYGKIFRIGEGEMPGERYGCRCGMEILVKEKELRL